MITLELNKAHYPVTVLGPGRRIGIWFQGCTIGCAGCLSRDTWARDAGKAIAIDELVRWCREVSDDAPDGVTISGGEPFEQPEALGALLDALDQWRSETGADFDLLAYSGRPLRRLRAEHPTLLARLDALIPEPYVDALPLGKALRGSSNQPLVPLSLRGTRRYATIAAAAAADAGRRLQVAVEPKRIWYIGIPGRGEMARIEAECHARGLVFTSSSWR